MGAVISRAARCVYVDLVGERTTGNEFLVESIAPSYLENRIDANVRRMSIL